MSTSLPGAVLSKSVLYQTRSPWVAQTVKNLPSGTGFSPWVGKIPWRREWLATHPSVLAWRIPWTEEPGRLQSTGSQRVRHGWMTNTKKENLRSIVPALTPHTHQERKKKNYQGHDRQGRLRNHHRVPSLEETRRPSVLRGLDEIPGQKRDVGSEWNRALVNMFYFWWIILHWCSWQKEKDGRAETASCGEHRNAAEDVSGAWQWQAEGKHWWQIQHHTFFPEQRAREWNHFLFKDPDYTLDQQTQANRALIKSIWQQGCF